MGLAEKKATKEFEQTHYPNLLSAIQQAAACPVEVEIKWETLQEDGMGHLSAEAWPEIYFKPVINAFKNITADDMGKEALTGALKKVVIQNVKQVYGKEAYSFEGGVVTVDHKPYTNISDTNQRTEALQNLLESKL